MADDLTKLLTTHRAMAKKGPESPQEPPKAEQGTMKPAMRKKAATGQQSRKTGRPKNGEGKRDNPDYSLSGAYVHNDVLQDVKIELLRQRREYSGLIQELLEDWLKQQTGKSVNR